MNIQIVLSAVVLCMCLVAGCSADENFPVDGPDAGKNTGRTGHAMVSDLLLGHQTYVTPRGSSTSNSVRIDLHHPDSGHSVSGGDIAINGSIIPRWNITGGTWYQDKDESWQGPLVLDGSYHVFNIPGDPGFPAFVDSVRSPYGATTITFPTITDTLSRSAGATIRWTPTGGVDGVRVMVHDTSTTIGSKMFVKTVPGNSGSLRLSPSELSRLKPGPITVRVYCGNLKMGVAGPEQKYQIIVFSSQGVRAWLKD